MAAEAVSISVEEWRVIPGWEGFYEASSWGRIRSVERTYTQTFRGTAASTTYPSVVRSFHVNKSNGYLVVGLTARGRGRQTCCVHSLIAEAFLGRRPKGSDVAHNNGNRHDNRVINLRWASRAENLADMVRHGTQRVGERHGNARLTGEAVKQIRAAGGTAEKNRFLAAKHGVSERHIRKILAGIARRAG